MWKSLTRGIRETLERRTCRTNVYSQSTQDGNTNNGVKKSNLLYHQKFLAPCFSSYIHGCCGRAKAGGAKDDQYDSKWKAKHTWTEAVGWSSVLAVGWVVCQSLCIRKRIFDRETKWHTSITQLSEAHLKYLLAPILNLKPNHVLPVTNCVGNSNFNGGSSNEECETNQRYGPITAEEALNEAADQFAKTHKVVMGELELHYGVKAIEEERYKDAVKHFSTGAKLLSPGSMFNLGLCHELGLGTLVDLKKAAKYYSQAAERGHADAMYNLGVFHAQGKGGFEMDVDLARELFVKAANLGQADALHALDLETIESQSDASDSNSFTLFENQDHSMSQVQNCGAKNISKKLGTGYKNAVHFHSETLQRIEELKSSTDIFLDILGVTKSSPIPVGLDNVSY